jgi:hypothetical protein
MRRPVKARRVGIAARLGLRAGRLGEGFQASSEVLIGRSQPMRLERIAPAIECGPELIQNPLVTSDRPRFGHLAHPSHEADAAVTASLRLARAGGALVSRPAVGLGVCPLS